MQHFFYKYQTNKGSIAFKMGFYESAIALNKDLKNNNETLLDFYSLPATLSRLIDNLSGKPTNNEIIELCNHLSLYISNGIDLRSALMDLQASVKKNAFKTYINSLRMHIGNGFLPSQAFDSTNGTPAILTKMARIGENSGTLENTLEDASNYLSYVANIKKSIKRALIYPSFILSILSAGLLFWIVFVVPQVVDLFKSLNIEIPAGLAFVVTLSELVSNNFWYAVYPSLLIVILVYLYKKNINVRLFIDKKLWSMPFFSTPIQKGQKSFFFQYLGLLYNSGVTITEALETVIDSIYNSFFKSRISNMNVLLRNGNPLNKSLSDTDLFEPLTMRMINIGETTGTLSDQLAKISDIYKSELDEFVNNITKTIEPALMLIVAVFFGFFAMTLIGPLYDLLSGIG